VKISMSFSNRKSIVVLFGLLLLTGCPGKGDSVVFDEIAQVRFIEGKVCFLIKDALDYQPVYLGINPRGTPSKLKIFKFQPDVRVMNDRLCIPSDLYALPKKGQFITEYLLRSKNDKNHSRKFVVVFEVNNGRVYNIPPTNKEVTRPYNEMLE